MNNHRNRSFSRRRMAGQSTVEFVIAVPVALFLILCTVQLVLLLSLIHI